MQLEIETLQFIEQGIHFAPSRTAHPSIIYAKNRFEAILYLCTCMNMYSFRPTSPTRHVSGLEARQAWKVLTSVVNPHPLTHGLVAWASSHGDSVKSLDARAHAISYQLGRDEQAAHSAAYPDRVHSVLVDLGAAHVC